MNLIDAYVYEVTRRLPKKSRDDIAMELKFSIEDMLPEGYTEKEVKEALAKMDDPAILAASYRDKPMYLIGPRVYDAYIETLKMIFPWAILICVILNVVASIGLFNGEEAVLSVIINIFTDTIVNVIYLISQVFIWVTIVFVIVERVGLSKNDLPLTKRGTPWTPEDLKDVRIVPAKKMITTGEIVFSILWTVIWAVIYWNADHLAGIYRSAEDTGLQLVMPIFDQQVLLSYWPLVVAFIVLEIGLALYKWYVGQWTKNVAIVNGIIHTMSIITFIIITSHANLYNEATIPYMANVLEMNIPSLLSVIEIIWIIIVVSVVISTVMELADSYKKAKI
ncbi:hypothetical protein NSQ95_18240 [Psychrobacillus sp. FSL W7-1457]|uniref:HAAS signaling domain-containing protein n=1 Tax=Psychrobacillus sp. FSL W7-1457 TaxID=2954547 RepID=UPI00315A23B6